MKAKFQSHNHVSTSSLPLETSYLFLLLPMEMIMHSAHKQGALN